MEKNEHLSAAASATVEAFCRKVASYAAVHALLPAGDDGGGLLLGLSGGADSTALLCGLRRLGVRVVAAHCNFGLRGEESDADERHVRRLCEQLCVPLTVRRFDVAAYRRRHAGTSVEMACRQLRYPWFEQLRADNGLTYIAVAHHADDNVETAVLNSLRGTGLRGIAGIAPKNGRVVRPLLCVNRGDVEAFLAALNRPYVTDSTNGQNVYARNRVRHILLPAVERTATGGVARLRATVENLRDNAVLYDDMLRHVAGRFADTDGVLRRVDVRRLTAEASNPAMLLYELVRSRGFNRQQCDAATRIAFENHTESRQFLSVTHTLTVRGYVIDIERRYEPLKEELEVDFSDMSPLKGILEVLPVERPFDPTLCNGRTTIALSADVRRCARVVLRPWRRGDRLLPFGMKGSRLVSDILAPARLTPARKRRVLLLEADGRVLWVLGWRSGSHYAVAAGATDYLLLRCGGDGR